LKKELANVTFHFVCPDDKVAMICELQVSFECFQNFFSGKHFFKLLEQANSAEEMGNVISRLQRL
jgi:hypothetical protein